MLSRFELSKVNCSMCVVSVCLKRSISVYFVTIFLCVSLYVCVSKPVYVCVYLHVSVCFSTSVSVSVFVC